MQVPTGGKAHEPQGMIRCNSEADSIVWMEEDDGTQDETDHSADERSLWIVLLHSGALFLITGKVLCPFCFALNHGSGYFFGWRRLEWRTGNI